MPFMSRKRTAQCAIMALTITGTAAALAIDAIVGPPALAQSRTQATIDISIFFDELAPHGRWVETRRYGYVFLPAEIDEDWRPYTRGRWVNTERYGWYWVSDEPFGWATYHYGRWGYDPDYGWFWVPGNVWAPAWVSWQTSEEYIGWAPLPPVRQGYAFSAEVGSVSIAVGAWHFVSVREFLEPRLAVHILPPRRNAEIIRVVRPAGTVRVVNNIVVNKVIDVRRIERVTGQRVVRHEVDRVDRPARADLQGERIRAFTPTLAARRPAERPRDAA
ncbi:MAG TPA: DUF6600 domain-containing protein, partial [Hyphomicrobiaceae bacterium]|nr:DUF6600 domain-containing protein [Hyphomicrobiaceae bacterium]